MGRRRRSSNSTVATVDDAHMRFAKETSVLRPVPADMHDSEWPTYVLEDAVIYRSDKKTLANPLFVHLEGPLIVRGRVEVDSDNQQNFIRAYPKPTYIEISQSEKYSIGFGPCTLWVAGLGGWFEIVPAPKYEAMYSQIREAITLYYQILGVYEQYEEKRKKRAKQKQKALPQPSLEEVFFKYAVKVGDGSVYEDVVARCHKWAKFLLAHFPKEDDLDWETTDFKKWLVESHQELQDKITNAAATLAHRPAPTSEAPGTLAEAPKAPTTATIERQSSKAASKRGSRQNSHNEDLEMQDSGPTVFQGLQPEPIGKAKAVSKPISETPVPIPAKYLRAEQQKSHSASPAPKEATPAPKEPTPAAQQPTPAITEPEGPIDRLLAVLEDIRSEHTNWQTIQAKTICSQVYFKCRMNPYGISGPIIQYFSPQLLPRLGAEWHDTPFYQWLSEESTKGHGPPEGMTIDDMNYRLQRRHKQQKPRSPKESAVVRKEKNLKQALEDENSDQEVRPGKRPGRKSGKAATLRLASSFSKKRLASDLLDDDSATGGGSRRGRKSMKTSHHHDDDSADDDDSDESSDAESPLNEAADDDDSLAAGGLSTSPKDAVRLVVTSERIPGTSPSGPEGTWTCEQDGCGFVVRDAESQPGQDSIQEHFSYHEAQAEKINLALKESRGHLPINHLLEKIQALGKSVFKKQEATTTTVNGEPRPKPIKRRMLL